MKVYIRAGSARLECPKASKGPGHMADVHFVWQEGSEHVAYHAAELTCACGERLVHVAGADPWQHPTRDVEGTPHGA